MPQLFFIISASPHTQHASPVFRSRYLITGAYALSAVYYDNRALADALDAPSAPPLSADAKAAKLQSRTLDMTAWHALATVLVTPVVIIPAIKVGAKRVFSKMTFGSAALREKTLPATIAILSIPAVVSPVDNAVTFAFNETVREKKEPYHWTGYWPESLNEHHAPPTTQLK